MLWSSDFPDALEDHHWATLDMQSETQFEWTQRCTGRPWLSEIWHGIGGWDRENLNIYSKAVTQWDWGSTWRRSLRREARWQLRLYSLVNLELWDCWVLSTTTSTKIWNWLGAGDYWSENDAVIGVNCTWCKLYLVYAVLSVYSWSWHGEIERDDFASYSLVMAELNTRKR